MGGAFSVGGVKAKGKQLLIWKKLTAAARQHGSIIHFGQCGSGRGQKVTDGGQDGRRLHPYQHPGYLASLLAPANANLLA